MSSSPVDKQDGREAVLADYVAVLRRRWRFVVGVMVAAVLFAALLSAVGKDRYGATADVLLSRQDIAAILNNTPNQQSGVPADRLGETLAQVAAVPQVAELAIRVAGPSVQPLTADDLLDASSVVPEQNADILRFTVESDEAEDAWRLASAYATAFTAYKRELDSSAITRARRDVQAQLTRLRTQGRTSGDLFEDLTRRDQQLATLITLQTEQSSVVRRPTEADKVAPRPVRNVLLGILLGLVLGVGAAFLRDSLDVRVRTEDEIADTLGLPMLGRVSKPPEDAKVVMLTDPGNGVSEQFRILRTTVEFASPGPDARALLVASAEPAEGKSTTAANLATALARAGRRVVLVDLDLRRPKIGEIFGLAGRGVTDVVAGRADISDVLNRVILEEPDTGGGELSVFGHGTLDVVTAGTSTVSAGEFASSDATQALLTNLRANADVLVIDTPPVLRVGDTMEIATASDNILVVARLSIARRPLLVEFQRALALSPAKPIGVVVTDPANDPGGYGSGYSYRDATATQLSALAGRVNGTD